VSHEFSLYDMQRNLVVSAVHAWVTLLHKMDDYTGNDFCLLNDISATTTK